MTLDKALLHYFARDALAPYSEDFSVRDKQNPIRIELNGALYSIHISYVHDSGNTRANEDEARIQISRSLIEQQRQRHNAGERVAFIGFFEDGKTFVAWDPRHVFSLEAKTVVSVYARQSQEEQAEIKSASVHQFKAKFLNDSSFAIAFTSNFLGFYLENISRFHRIRSESSIQSLIRGHEEVFSDTSRGISGDFEIGQEGERERFTFTRKAFIRDPRFKKHVLAAYNRTCCICNRQLAIVQAAHIIPHSEPDCPNTVANGLALCIEHHRLYDDALLLPGPGGRLVFNEERAEYLRQTQQQRGLDEIAAQHGKQFSIPVLAECHPSDQYLQRGLEIRLGQ
jgi:putative restriction endonuclease